MKNHSADKIVRNKSFGDHYNEKHRYVKEKTGGISLTLAFIMVSSVM